MGLDVGSQPGLQRSRRLVALVSQAARGGACQRPLMPAPSRPLNLPMPRAIAPPRKQRRREFSSESTRRSSIWSPRQRRPSGPPRPPSRAVRPRPSATSASGAAEVSRGRARRGFGADSARWIDEAVPLWNMKISPLERGLLGAGARMSTWGSLRARTLGVLGLIPPPAFSRADRARVSDNQGAETPETLKVGRRGRPSRLA